MLARYQSKAELSVVGGRLLTKGSGLTVDDWTALRLLEPYLVGLLLGAPVGCAFDGT